MVLCAGNSVRGLVFEGVAGGDHGPFLGDTGSQLVTFLYIKQHQALPLPGFQCSEIFL